MFPRAVLSCQGREGRDGNYLLCARDFVIENVFKMADGRENELEPKHLPSQTLFPILGTERGVSKASGSLIFPSASFKVEERAADFGRGKKIGIYC